MTDLAKFINKLLSVCLGNHVYIIGVNKFICKLIHHISLGISLGLNDNTFPVLT